MKVLLCVHNSLGSESRGGRGIFASGRTNKSLWVPASVTKAFVVRMKSYEMRLLPDSVTESTIKQTIVGYE